MLRGRTRAVTRGVADTLGADGVGEDELEVQVLPQLVLVPGGGGERRGLDDAELHLDVRGHVPGTCGALLRGGHLPQL